MNFQIAPGDGIVGELELLGELIIGGFPDSVFTLVGVNVDEVLDAGRLYDGFGADASAAAVRVRSLQMPEFVGVEGEFFRGRVPVELAGQLDAASESYGRVGTAIRGLARELDGGQIALRPLESRARAVFEHMQAVWVKVNVPFTEYSRLRGEWDELVRAATAVHERVAAAGQAAATEITAGTEVMARVNEFFSALPGGAVVGGAAGAAVRSTASRAVLSTAGALGAPGRGVKAAADGLAATAGVVTSVPEKTVARGQQLAAEVTPDGIRIGDVVLTDPTSDDAQKLVRDGLATNVLGLDPTGVPTAMMMLASPSTLMREQPRKGKARRWASEDDGAPSDGERNATGIAGQIVSVPGRFVGGLVDRAGNTVAGNAALIGVGGDPVRAWTGLAGNVLNPVNGVTRGVASATPAQILKDPIAAAGATVGHAPAAIPFVGWAYGLVELAAKPGELARSGAKESIESSLDEATKKYDAKYSGHTAANTGTVQVTTGDVDIHADNGGYVTFTLPDLEGGEPKAWYIMATPDSPGNFTTQVPHEADEELVERGDGSVVLVNTTTGQNVRTIKTPWAKDALGRDQPTWYSVEKIDDRTSTITQHIAPNRGALYPLIADSPASDLQAAMNTQAGMTPGPKEPAPASPAPAPTPPPAPAPEPAPAPVVDLTPTVQASGPHLAGTPAPTVTTPDPKPAPTPEQALAVLPGGLSRALSDGAATPEANVSITLPKDGGASTAGVGQIIGSGGGQVTQSPNRTNGAVKVERPRDDSSGVSDVTAVNTAVRPGSVPGVIGTGSGNVRVTDATVSVRDESTGVETVTGTAQQVVDADAARPTAPGGLTPEAARTVMQTMPALGSMLTVSPTDGAVSVRTPTDTGTPIPSALTSPGGGGASWLLSGVGAVDSGRGTLALPGSDGRIVTQLPGGGTQTTLPDMRQVTERVDPESKSLTKTTVDMITGAVNATLSDPATQITQTWTVDGNGTGQVVFSKPGEPTQTYRVAGDRIIEAAPVPPVTTGGQRSGWDKVTSGDWLPRGPLNTAFRFEKGVATNLYGTAQGVLAMTPHGQIDAFNKFLTSPEARKAFNENRWNDLWHQAGTIAPVGVAQQLWEVGKSSVNTGTAGYTYLSDSFGDRPTDKSRDAYYSRLRSYGNNWSKTLIGTDFQDPNKTLAEKLGSASAGGVTLLVPVKGASVAKGASAAGHLETGALRAETTATTPASRTAAPHTPSLATPLETPKPTPLETPKPSPTATVETPKLDPPTSNSTAVTKPDKPDFTTSPGADRRAGEFETAKLAAAEKAAGEVDKAASGVTKSAVDAPRAADTPDTGDKPLSVSPVAAERAGADATKTVDGLGAVKAPPRGIEANYGSAISSKPEPVDRVSDPSFASAGSPTPQTIAKLQSIKEAISSPPIATYTPERGFTVPKGTPERDLFETLRPKSPPRALRMSQDALQGMGRPRIGDPDLALPGRRIETTSAGLSLVSPDHIVSVAEMIHMPGFTRLSAADMYRMINWRENLQWLSRPANYAKGSRVAEDVVSWKQDFRTEQTLLEAASREQVQEMIDRLLMDSK